MAIAADFGDRLRIIADDRENAGGVIAQLRTFPEVTVDVRRLKTGDFEIGERCLVERKTLADFACSVVDSRLFRQAAALVRSARCAILILEGNSLEKETNGVSREALQGALITVSIFYGLAVLRAKDSAETARLLVYLGQQDRKVARGALSRHGYRPKGKRARQLFILQGLPGVGPERAARLLDRFGSIQAVTVASSDELAGIDGIGATIAKRIRWVLEPDDTIEMQPGG